MQEEGKVEICGCGAEEHPIIISDSKLTIIGNGVPIKIQVECPLPKDHLMSDNTPLVILVLSTQLLSECDTYSWNW